VTCAGTTHLLLDAQRLSGNNGRATGHSRKRRLGHLVHLGQFPSGRLASSAAWLFSESVHSLVAFVDIAVKVLGHSSAGRGLGNLGNGQ